MKNLAQPTFIIVLDFETKCKMSLTKTPTQFNPIGSRRNSEHPPSKRIVTPDSQHFRSGGRRPRYGKRPKIKCYKRSASGRRETVKSKISERLKKNHQKKNLLQYSKMKYTVLVVLLFCIGSAMSQYWRKG